MYWDFSLSKCYVIGSYTKISFVDRSTIICFSARLILFNVSKFGSITIIFLLFSPLATVLA